MTRTMDQPPGDFSHLAVTSQSIIRGCDLQWFLYEMALSCILFHMEKLRLIVCELRLNRILKLHSSPPGCTRHLAPKLKFQTSV